MVTDAQVRLLRQKRMESKTMEAAAAAAAMSVRSAQKWQGGPLPSERRRPRHWRTWPDAFAEVWDTEVVPLLRSDEKGVLQAGTLLEVLDEKHPGQFGISQLRTLQRKLRDWRALHGPEKEVFFPQKHPPGREAQMDFTHATELGVTIRGALLEHLLFEFVLSFSGWTWSEVAFGETFEALSAGVQGAVWELGGSPAVARTDNLSAATHELRLSGGRAFNRRWKALLDHYEMTPTRINPGESHEDGVVEQKHNRTKSALAQALVLRGSSDFESLSAYQAFLREVIAAGNRRVAEKLAAERPHLRPLPLAPVASYTKFAARVARWSTVGFAGRHYSVPSRLIGHVVEARQYPDTVEVYYRGQLVETMPRIRGEGGARIDYRHVIWSLVRKPGAFARYRYREELFPSLTFRRAYDQLRAARGDRADVEYVRILHLAASTMEATVEKALDDLLARGAAFDYDAVRALASPERPAVPEVKIQQPDLGAYDRLLVAGGGL
jgi:hypothetical protein